MRESRTAVTIRFPKPLLVQARALTNPAGSFNDLVVQALEAEVRVRYAREIGKRLDEYREEIFRAHGLLSDSTPIIRQLREGIGRWDQGESN